MSSVSTPTPAMRQYLDAKRQYRDAIVFFRMGDFYEMFYEDALVASRALELTLTSRSKDAGGQGIPMCGVPFHAADAYIARLVKKGFRVAICEQVEDPRKAKGLVRREVVRVVSPGTLTEPGYLDAREPAFLMAIAPARDGLLGVALVDVSTGEFSTTEYHGEDGLQALTDEIAVLRPREVVVPADAGVIERLPGLTRLQIAVTSAEGWTFELETARRALLDQLKTHGLEGFGLDGRTAAIQAAGGLVAYLRETQKADLAHVRAIGYRTSADCLIIDPITLKHLEVVTGSEGGAQGSLLKEIDRTITSMGGRLLRAWLLRPLCALERIRDRLDAVEELAFRSTERGKFRETLKTVHDLERLVARAALSTAGPRELVSLRLSLAAVPRVKLILRDVQAPLLASLCAELDDVADVRDLIERTLVDEPPAAARDGGFTRDGVDAELDDLRTVSRSGRQVIAEMEERERGANRDLVLEGPIQPGVRLLHRDLEVESARRPGRLHAEADHCRWRAVYDARAQGIRREGSRRRRANPRARAGDLRGSAERVAAEAARIQDTARALATLDVLAALAETAAIANYTKPHLHDGDEMIVIDGRHPVVERYTSDAFVPNDIDINGTTRQLVVLTGPNMGGKSTYLRQTALIPLLAQIGSFVPAKDAKLPIVDRIFARVGAADNIARGQSTFMVEMQETANILHASTSRSLVVLDEIGRGTSTFDGLSIAWAVAEYLATNPRARPKTLFATHYHELTDLADALPGVVNAHVSAREWKDDIIFLRKIVSGRSDRSYGIQVARLAGLPGGVVARAQEILSGLERDELSRGGRPTLSGVAGDPSTRQLGLFASPTGIPASPHHQEIADRLKSIEIDDTTPRQALELLAELKKLSEDM